MNCVRQALLFPFLTLCVSAAPESYPCQNGLVRSLVAREPMFMNPVSVAVDTDGSIYVTETVRRKQADLDIREVMDWVTEDLSHTSVEQKRDFFRRNITPERFKNHPSLKDHDRNGTIDWKDLTVHSEKIHKLVDTDGDGAADKATLFAEGFHTEVTGIAAGVLARHGDVYATIAPDVWKLRDSDGDGKADERKAIASGFGVHINYAGHDMHGLTFGPDGKLYWTIGDKGTNVVSGGTRWRYPHEGALLRCNPDGSEFEVFARGLRNVQQIAFDDYGNIFGVDNDSDQSGEKERLLYIVEGSDAGWRCYYQYRGGKYNPWMAERIAFPDGEDRPASILPPLSLYLDGPSGFAYNPGTALNERYRGHFFMTQFPAGKINAFKLEPDGASYKMTGDHLMASGTPFTGCNFGPDGALYVADWQGGYPLKEKGAVWKIDDPKEAGSAMRKEVAAILKEGAEKAADEVLVSRLGHADQRVRLDAQWELARRGKSEELKTLAGNPAAGQLARIHALWGLSQGKQFDDHLFRKLVEDSAPEVRAQAAKWAGETMKPLPVAALARLLSDPSARVRFHAAMAARFSSSPEIFDAVVAMLVENAGRDEFLSHAGMMALCSADEEQISEFFKHESPSVRLAVVVALRRNAEHWGLDLLAQQGSGTFQLCVDDFIVKSVDLKRVMTLIEKALYDESEDIVSEAAGALYDLRSFKALAHLLGSKSDARPAAIRRAIAANRRIGDETSLLRLIHFAARADRPAALRIAALEALASVKSTDPLDPVDGRYAPLKPVKDISPSLSIQAAATLSKTAQEPAFAKDVRAALHALGAKQHPETLAHNALDPSLDPDLRLAALQDLKESGQAHWTETALKLLDEQHPAIRTGSAAILASPRPSETLAYIRNTGLKSKDLAERQSAVRLLATIPDAKPVLDSLLAELTAGTLDPSIQFEVIESASTLQLDSLHEARAALAAKGPLGPWTYALAGGNAAAGKKVFEENLAANCTACHRIGKEGSNVGPPLARIGAKDRAYLLQSLLDPQASIAPGFGAMTATKKDGTALAGNFIEEKEGKLLLAQADGSKLQVPLAEIESKTAPVSSMPPMTAILKPAELRDLVEFLSSLK